MPLAGLIGVISGSPVINSYYVPGTSKYIFCKVKKIPFKPQYLLSGVYWRHIGNHG